MSQPRRERLPACKNSAETGATEKGAIHPGVAGLRLETPWRIAPPVTHWQRPPHPTPFRSGGILRFVLNAAAWTIQLAPTT